MKLLSITRLLIPLAVAAPAVCAAADSKSDFKYFEEKIRPILIEHCYKCHNAGQGAIKSELALDTREGARAGGSRGPAIVPGKPEASLLIKAIGYADSDLQMPPDGKLPDALITELTLWVKIGAPDPREGSQAAIAPKMSGLTAKARAHWAFQPVRQPPTPKVRHAGWVRSPIDAFIVAKLEAAGIEPGPPATKEALLRRATFDLIGMPPTSGEYRAFLADNSTDAFAKVVDRLLASPHYGERWGRHWLDTARYADTMGLGATNVERQTYRFPYAWSYRDYVVESYNDDKPYDRFILEQLAADKLTTRPDDPCLAALGFITVGARYNQPNDTINERIDAVSKGFLGLTVSCARCHDHMFDPIPTADYYSLHGIFNNTVEPLDKPIIGKPNAQSTDYAARVEVLHARNRDVYYQTIAEMGRLFRQKAGTYMVLCEEHHELSKAEVPAFHKRVERERGVDLRFLSAGHIRTGGPDDAVWGPLVRFRELKPEEYAAKAGALAAEISANGPRKKGAQYNARIAAMFARLKPGSLADVEDAYNRLFAGLDREAAAYLDARSHGRPAPASFDASLIQLLDEPLRYAPLDELVAEPLYERHPRIRDLGQGFKNGLKGVIEFDYSSLNMLEMTHPGAPARAMIVADVDNPVDSPILVRGQAQVPGDIVPRRFLEILSPPDRPEFKEGSGRLPLARAIASGDNPLTPRVLVNRVWMHHFGEGFINTPDDLGVQSEKPSHPELLDWLADSFLRGGWSLKKLHRQIMLTSVYQQAYREDEHAATVDPNNRLMWRANSRRLDFEAIRDSLLVFSGKLNQTVGGKPINLTAEPYSYRRSIYGYIDRGTLPEVMQQFDFSDPVMPNSSRSTTVVPQQALFFMNSPMTVDVVRHMLARPEVASAKSDIDRIKAIYAIIFQRAPRPQEISLGAAFIASQPEIDPDDVAKVGPKKSTFSAQEKQSASLSRNVRVVRAPVTNDGEIVERRPLTVWEQYAQALLFANELVFVN